MTPVRKASQFVHAPLRFVRRRLQSVKSLCNRFTPSSDIPKPGQRGLLRINVARRGCDIRVARFEDHEQIALLQAAYGLKSVPYEEWKHLWSDNPLYQRLADWPIGWVIQDLQDKIVGYVGNVPRAYQLGDRALIAGCGTGMVVDSSYRSFTFFLLSRFFRQQFADIIINNTVNAKGAALHRLFRCVPAPTGRWDQSKFWVTNYEGFVASLAARHITSDIMIRLLAMAASVRDVVTPTERSECGDGIEIDVFRGFDGRFDEFWAELKRQRPTILLANRSQEMLEWHFKYALAQNSVWVMTVSNNGHLVAYSVFRRSDNPTLQLKRVRIVDFQTLHGPDLLVPMVSRAISRCYRESVHMLEAIGFRPDTERVIDSMAPYTRKLSSWLYFYRSNNAALATALTDSEVWDPTLYDGDGSLF
jgi:hypothetical protein